MDSPEFNLKKALRANGAVPIVLQAYKKYVGSSLHWYRHAFQYVDSLPHKHRLIDVNPSDIEYVVRPGHYTTTSRYGTWFVDGDWDKGIWDIDSEEEYQNIKDKSRKLMHFSDFNINQGLRGHFVHNVSWPDTNMYKFYRNKIENSQISWGCASLEELENKCDHIDNLYKSISKSGYKTQKELGNPSDLTHPEHGEVAIAIGRDGEMYLDEGRHRLIIAQILEVPNIPVRVHARHKQWQETRKAISQNSSKTSPYLIEHPDIEDIIIK